MSDYVKRWGHILFIFGLVIGSTAITSGDLYGLIFAIGLIAASFVPVRSYNSPNASFDESSE